MAISAKVLSSVKIDRRRGLRCHDVAISVAIRRMLFLWKLVRDIRCPPAWKRKEQHANLLVLARSLDGKRKKGTRDFGKKNTLSYQSGLFWRVK